MAYTQDFISTAAVGSVQRLGRPLPELTLEIQPSSVLHLPHYLSATPSSSHSLTVNHTIAEGIDEKRNQVEDITTPKICKWRGKYRNWRYGAKKGKSTIEQNHSVQSKETSKSVISLKISKWKKLVARLIHGIHQFPPARSESVASTKLQQTDNWPKLESIEMLAPKHALELNKSSSLRSHPLHISCIVRNHPSVPLWKRRNAPEPLGIDLWRLR